MQDPKNAKEKAKIQTKFQKQKSYMKRNPYPPIDFRKQRLSSLLKAIVKAKNEICEALHSDLRKNPTESLLTEVYPAVMEINYFINNLSKLVKPKRVKTPLPLKGTSARTELIPRGQVLIISPWNYPFNLCMLPLIDAIAAGNVVVLKPSEYTPQTNQIVKKLIEQTFTPEEVFVAEGDAEVSQFLISLAPHHVFFTGSSEVGKKVMKSAADHLCTITLELGGKSPAIVDSSADLDQAASAIMWGKCLNAGQTCIAPDYLLVEKKIAEKLKEKLKQKTKEFYPDKNYDDMAVIISSRHFEKLCELYKKALTAGANLVHGGEFFSESRLFAPTILDKIQTDNPIMQAEIFGPILPILEFEKPAEAISIVELFPRPLAMYLFSKNQKTIDSYLSAITCGGVCINDTLQHVANHHLPFGGINQSGTGQYHGIHGLNEFSHQRSILERKWNLGNHQIFPPYTETKEKILGRLLSFFGS